MLKLNGLTPNELFVRIYYVPNLESELKNVAELKRISSKLAHCCLITNTPTDSNGINIGVNLVNGGVVRRPFRDYQGLVLVINEKYAFQDAQNFAFVEKDIFEKEGMVNNDNPGERYYNSLSIICNYISLIPGLKFTPSQDLYYSDGFVWSSEAKFRQNFRTFDN